MMKSKIFVFSLIIILFGLHGYSLMRDTTIIRTPNLPPPAMTDEFVGAYVCEEIPHCSLAAVPQDNNAFYFLNYADEQYISGTFEKQADNTYTLSGDEIDTQTIVCEKLSFSLIFDDQELVFNKINEIPIVPGNLDELLQ